MDERSVAPSPAREPPQRGAVRHPATESLEPRSVPSGQSPPEHGDISLARAAALAQSFLSLWRRQHEFNEAVALRDGAPLSERHSWTTSYLLGLASELDEVLRTTQWKRHRMGGPPRNPNRTQLGLELADLFKYVLCLFQVWDFTVEEMLAIVHEKSELVERRFFSEFTQPHEGQPVLLCDVDNTLINFQTSLFTWLSRQHPEVLPDNAALTTLNGDLDLHLPWDQYRNLKAEFEASGGYGPEWTAPYPDAARLLAKARASGWFIVVFTARPEHEFTRIWLDTWRTLRHMGTTPDQLRFGSYDRLLLGKNMMDAGHPVLYVEDNPDLAQRAGRLGIRTIVRRHPYNVALEQFLDQFPSLGLTEHFDDQWLHHYLASYKESYGKEKQSEGGRTVGESAH